MSYTKRESWVTEVPAEQRHLLKGGLSEDKPIASAANRQAKAPLIFPPEVDHRPRFVSPVKNQSASGSCVTFATMAMFESMHMIENGSLLQLSEADLHFCSSHGPTIDAMPIQLALESIRSRGVCPEALFPFSEGINHGNTRCVIHPDRLDNLWTLGRNYRLTDNSEAKYHIANIGPIVCFVLADDDFMDYGEGVFDKQLEDLDTNHALCIVGYSESGGYWICKNSWGTAWGEDGFIRIAYGAANIDVLPKYGASGVSKLTTPVLDIYPNRIALNPYGATTYHVGIEKSNWEAVPGEPWCDAGKLPDDSIELQVTENPTHCPRFAVVTISAPGHGDANLIVKQPPNPLV